MRAHPHTTTPNASTPAKSNHPTRRHVSESSHNAGATPHTGAIARWRMADPPTSSHMSRVARILRHTQPAEHHRKSPSPPASAAIHMPIHTQRAADPRSPSGTLRIQPPAYATTNTTRRTQPAVTQDHQHPTDHACRDKRFLRNTLDKTDASTRVRLSTVGGFNAHAWDRCFHTRTAEQACRDIRQPTPPTREHATMQRVTTQPATMQIPDRHRHSSFPAIRCGLNGTPI